MAGSPVELSHFFIARESTQETLFSIRIRRGIIPSNCWTEIGKFQRFLMIIRYAPAAPPIAPARPVAPVYATEPISVRFALPRDSFEDVTQLTGGREMTHCLKCAADAKTIMSCKSSSSVSERSPCFQELELDR